MKHEDITKPWIRQKLGWEVRENDQVVLEIIGENMGNMGSVFLLTCGQNSCVVKFSLDDGTEWSELMLKTDSSGREFESYNFLSSVSVTPLLYHYEAGESGALFLEDLTNGEVANFSEGMTYKQTMLAVKSLAFLHSRSAEVSSHGDKAPKPWLYTCKSDDLIEAFELGFKYARSTFEAELQGCLRRLLVEQVLGTNIRQVLAEAHHEAKLSAICHGDMWSNNIIFQEKKSGSVNALLIDWQYTMWGNPLSDLALLMFSSVGPKDRIEWFETVLSEYHTALIEYHPTLRESEYKLVDCRSDYARASAYAVLTIFSNLDGMLMAAGESGKHDFVRRLNHMLEGSVPHHGCSKLFSAQVTPQPRLSFGKDSQVPPYLSPKSGLRGSPITNGN